MRYLGYYGYPYYWGGAGLWGAGAYPNMMMPGYPGFVIETASHTVRGAKSFCTRRPAQHQDDDPHLRSCKAVMSYHIQATDGDIGHVQGLLVDEETWAIRYMIVNTSNWWLGHQVLVAPQWIQDVSWHDSTVSVNLTRQAVKNAPPYDSTARWIVSRKGHLQTLSDVPAIGRTNDSHNITPATIRSSAMR